MKKKMPTKIGTYRSPLGPIVPSARSERNWMIPSKVAWVLSTSFERYERPSHQKNASARTIATQVVMTVSE